MNPWTLLMVASAGLFTGGAMAFVWERIPAWQAMPLSLFMSDFANTIRRADRLQPVILIASIATSLGFGMGATATERTLAFIGTAGFVVTLLASVTVLVPLQRRIIGSSHLKPEVIDAMRHKWFRGHVGRSALGLASFLLVSTAAAL